MKSEQFSDLIENTVIQIDERSGPARCRRHVLIMRWLVVPIQSLVLDCWLVACASLTKHVPAVPF